MSQTSSSGPAAGTHTGLLVTLTIIAALGFAYWLYGGASVLAALFVWKFVPETKGRTLEAMRDLWHKAPAKSAA